MEFHRQAFDAARDLGRSGAPSKNMSHELVSGSVAHLLARLLLLLVCSLLLLFWIYF